MFLSLVRALRLIVGWLDLILYTLVLYALSFLPGQWTDRFYPRLFWSWCRCFVRALGVDLHLHQKNLEPLPEHYILIANHPSAFEDVGIPALFPVHSLAKIEVQDWWIAGRISAAADTLYVQREDRDSRQTAYQQIVDQVRLGKNIALYPEGGCKGKRLFETFRYGAFDISLKTGVPILPVLIHYEAQHDFEWRPGVSPVQKIGEILWARNKRANYYAFDAIDPKRFQDKKHYMEHVYKLYVDWQRRYLE